MSPVKTVGSYEKECHVHQEPLNQIFIYWCCACYFSLVNALIRASFSLEVVLAI